MAKDKVFYDDFEELCVECGSSGYHQSRVPGVCLECFAVFYSKSSSSEAKDSAYTTSLS